MEETEDGSSKIGGGEVVDGRFRRGEGVGDGRSRAGGGGGVGVGEEVGNCKSRARQWERVDGKSRVGGGGGRRWQVKSGREVKDGREEGLRMYGQ